MESYLQEEEVAKIIGVAKNTLAQWRMNGKGPPWYKPARRVLYPASGLDNWIKTAKDKSEDGDKREARQTGIQVRSGQDTVQKRNRFGGYKAKQNQGSSTGTEGKGSSIRRKGAGGKD